ncbi:MAG: glycosyltransferase family 4 protein [Solirubrobacteraceae bacterium]
MRVHIVDPSAYTPPYDHALCSALARRGADVELITSRFAYGPVALPHGYARREFFYRAARGPAGSRLRMGLKLAEHVPDMLRYRRLARSAQVVHFQWLTVQHLDRCLLPSRRRSGGAGGGAAAHRRPLVLTAHDVLPREPRPGQLRAQRRLYDRFDAIVVHSEHGCARLVQELGVEADRVRVIAHGAFEHLAEQPAAQRVEGLPWKSEKPVVLCFGLVRPYKGIDVLLRAWGELPPEVSAELWIAGMPKMDVSALRAAAPASVRFDMRFIGDDELPAYFERADLVVLPYLEADQSGVLFTALAFGKPLLLSDVGGFPEMASTGAARIVPAADAAALARALEQLLADPDGLARMGAHARAAARGPYSWDSVAQAHLTLYESLL